MKRILIISLLSIIFSQNEVCFEIEPNPHPNSQALGCFSKYVNVLDCFEIYAQEGVSDEKVLHVASVAAELLDNDEDGVVDNQAVFSKMQTVNAMILMWNESPDELSEITESDDVIA